MKGLLLKEAYLIRKYCKAYLLLMVVFLAVSFFGNDNLFFAFYPCLFANFIPVTLLSYDERSKWDQFCGTLPCTKAQQVSAKYVVNVCIQAIVFVVVGIAQAYRLVRTGSFSWEEYLSLLMVLIGMSAATTSVVLPLMFKWGTEKGRIAYTVMIGVICALSVMGSMLFVDGLRIRLNSALALPLMLVSAVALYAFSWYLSIVFYKKRER